MLKFGRQIYYYAGPGRKINIKTQCHNKLAVIINRINSKDTTDTSKPFDVGIDVVGYDIAIFNGVVFNNRHGTIIISSKC